MTISERARGLVQETPAHERPIAERFRLIGEEWADADAAFYMLDTSRSAVLAEIAAKSNAKSVADAERQARRSPEYWDHLERSKEAKRKANILRVRMKYLEMRFSMWNSADANARRERNMGRQST